MTSVPICVRCKHANFHYGRDPGCKRPIRETWNPVEGPAQVRLHTSCVSERRSKRTLFGRQKCGPAGRFFEPMGTPPGPSAK